MILSFSRLDKQAETGPGSQTSLPVCDSSFAVNVCYFAPAVYRWRVGSNRGKSFAVPEISGSSIFVKAFFLFKLCVLVHSTCTLEDYVRFVLPCRADNCMCHGKEAINYIIK